MFIRMKIELTKEDLAYLVRYGEFFKDGEKVITVVDEE